MSNGSNNNVQSFILNTLKVPLNDPKNSKYWLPGLLAGLERDGKPVLPLHEDSVPVSSLGSRGSYIANILAGDWSVFNSPKTAIPYPKSPLPVLAISDCTVYGLNNVSIVGSTSTALVNKSGYTSVVTLKFNAYGKDKVSETLMIKGSYDLKQDVCIAESAESKTCKIDERILVEGQGTFQADITDCYIEATVNSVISGAGASRLNTVVVEKVDVLGAGKSKPSVTFSKIAVTNTDIDPEGIASMAEMALNQPEGSEAMVSAVSSALNQSKSLDSFSDLLTKEVARALDEIFSKLPATGLPSDDVGQKAATEVDLYLFDRFRVAVNSQDSVLYLPLVIASSDDPVIEPYTSDEIDIPDQKISGVQFSSIKLTNVNVSGGSNLLMPQKNIMLTTPIIAGTITLGNLPAGASRIVPRKGKSISIDVPIGPPVSLKSNFSFVMKDEGQFDGTLSVTLTDAVANYKLQPSGTEASNLYLDISSFGLDLSAATSVAKVDIGSQFIDEILQGFFETAKGRGAISNGIDKQLSGELAKLSNKLSSILQETIMNQLGGDA